MTDPTAVPASGSPSHFVDPLPDGPGGTVLVIEDDPSIAEILTTALGARGHTVIVTRRGDAALRAVDASRPDVILLDLGLPDMDGLEVCRRVRQHSELPVIVLTADGDEARKVAALDLGADDYVTKPFSTPELMARVRVALRHRARAAAAAAPPGPAAVLELGALRIDAERYEVLVAGRPVRFTHKEFRLLQLLAARAGGLVPHAEILDQVWDGAGSAESVRVHVTHLRRKLGDAAGVEIRTEPGVGYRLVVISS